MTKIGNPHQVEMYKKIVPLIIIGLCLAMLVSCNLMAESEQESAPKIQLHPCQLTLASTPNNLKAECGELFVYEDRQSQSGKQIGLNIAVIPAISRSPAPDPIFFLAGGPGEAATQSYPLISNAFQKINQKRDVVLVDQRGTGGSNLLQCSAFSVEQETESTDPQELKEQLSSCLKELDADPTLYTTALAMDDLDEVRQALGYEKINLYGASYGTRAALAYARQYPDRVRSIILDGVAPPNWTLGPAVPEDAQRALEMLFNRCSADPDCQQAFPNLKQEFQGLLDQLAQKPIEVSLNHPVSGEPTRYTLDRDNFANLVHASTYTAESAAILPLMIHTTFERGDFTQFAAMALSNMAMLSETISPGMRFTVLCAEDIPYFGDITTPQGYLGDYFSRAFSSICETWPRAQIPADFKQPVNTSVPVLLLSGEADPVTPPSNAALAAQTLPNSLQIVAPGQGHIVIYRGCIPKIANTFIENSSVVGLDIACVQEIAPLPFFINPNGPHP